MKKIIAFIIAALLLLCMVSCGEAGETPTDTTAENPVETKPWTGSDGEYPNDLEIDFKY